MKPKSLYSIFSIICLLILSICACNSPNEKQEENKPLNVIYIMADDHATKAISCYNGNINNTPNIDRIANEGIRFDHCYVTNSICTPSRAAILTGTYNHVNCVTTLSTHMNNRMPNVAKHLKTGGYQTAVVGKWRMNGSLARIKTAENAGVYCGTATTYQDI